MYVPLRVHGHHSLLAGVDSPKAIVRRARELGLPAVALADVDCTAGLVDFLKAAQAEGVKPIVAAEISDPSGAPGRVVALVRDRQGFANLCKLVSARHLGEDPGEAEAHASGALDADGEASRFDLVARAVEYREGLTYLVDHPRLAYALFGRIERRHLLVAISPASLQRGMSRKGEMRGPRNAHLAPLERPASMLRPQEWEEPDGGSPKTPPPSRAVPASELVEAARATGLATVAASDVYHVEPAGAQNHRVRAAIGHNALVYDLPEEWVAEEPAHLLGFEETCALYAEVRDAAGPWKGAKGAGGVPPMVARTLEVAAECQYAPELGGVLFPDIELGEDQTAYSRLCTLAFEGAARRYRPLRPEVIRRLDRELAAIDGLGYAPYFLLVKQIADFAAREDIPCVGRGSAADSLVSYCLELTDADPLRYRLPFERFLNPSRKDRPDIDLDFCWRRRDEVIEHVYGAFGAERTAMISTLACFGMRSAFREAALVQGIPPAEINTWSRRLPGSAPSGALPFSGSADDGDGEEGPEDEPATEARLPEGALELPRELAHNPLARAIAVTPECRDFPLEEERWLPALRSAARLLDAPRHFGLHPGGTVVSPGPITDFVACQRAAKGVIVTQLDKDAAEAVGLVKMDLLGNRALTVIDDCTRELRGAGIEVDVTTIPEDDPATARVLREGRTLGCFQVESPGMRNLLKQTGARCMDDVIQAVALIRPGPAGAGMKDAYVRRFRGLEEPTPPHPRLAELLRDTHGIMLYQEDVMQAASLLAGLDLAEADGLRRALQKRREGELEELAARFFEGCQANGVARRDARRVWELIANFTAFAFCKAHAVTYGRISYRTVWLKTHHPAAFLTSFLRSETGYYEPRVYVEEARRLGVPILAPDINRSEASFSLEWSGARSGCLRIGLGQIKGLSQRTLEAILEGREGDGPFLSLPDLLERTLARTDEAERLVQCGALDSFDRTRPELLWRLHLLRQGSARPPTRLQPGEEPLDAARLAACRSTPRSRIQETIERAAHLTSGGWSGRGLGLGRARLEPGQTAALFPEPETPAPVLPGLPDLDPKTRGLLEHELLGLTIREHPVQLFPCEAEERARVPSPTPCAELDRRVGERITLRGWLAASRRAQTRNGDWMRFLTLEDESGIAEAVLFPDTYREFGHLLTHRGPHCITGLVEDQMGARTLHAERIW